MKEGIEMALLFCQVKCVGTCALICAADTISPVADVIGFAGGEARNFKL